MLICMLLNPLTCEESCRLAEGHIIRALKLHMEHCQEAWCCSSLVPNVGGVSVFYGLDFAATILSFASQIKILI